jgi:hypothetical protein
MALPKLTPNEISRAVDKIRRRYDEYIYKYFKPRSIKNAFEDRYIEAIKSSTDISNFLMAEISAVEELIRREEERVGSGQAEEPAPESVTERVERIVEENLARMRKYPEVPFHPVASEELRRLLGAMCKLEETHWEVLTTCLRNTAYYRSSLTMLNLEGKLRHLAARGSDGVPSGLSRYLYHANRFPRDYLAIDRQEKEYILESAFLLHDLEEILERVDANYPQLEEGSRSGLREIQAFIQGIIRDFRLKEFKRKQ